MNPRSILPALITGLLAAVLPVAAQIRPADRGTRIDNDPAVVHLAPLMEALPELSVVREAPVFSDHNGRHRLGFLRANQKVKVEAITDKAYRVRGQGTRDGISGWVAPWAFSASEPDFVEQFRKFYDRQIAVNQLIEAGQVAIGMTLDEVTLARGRPTKTSVRQTAEGTTGQWEFITIQEEKNYATRVNPVTGRYYRELVSVTQIEREKTVVEFENDIVTAVEESTAEKGGNIRVVVRPLFFRW